MKKKLLLFMLLLIPFMVNAKEKEVKITSVDLVELSDTATELSESSYNGLELNLNLRFKEVGDKAKYKVTIENTTNEDYELSDKIVSENSSFISYNTSFEDNTSTIKSNSSKVLYVTISYDKEVDDDKYTNGKYTEINSIVINLATNKGNNIDNDITVNPKTGVKLSIILSSIGLLMGIIALLVIKKEKASKSLMLLLITLLLVPISINAASKLFIKVNANIEIAKAYSVNYYYSHFSSYFTSEEMKTYNLSNEECDEPRYIGSVSEENKYTYCRGDIIWPDPDKYYAGDTVPLKTISRRIILTNGNPCVEGRDYFLCPKEVEIKETSMDAHNSYIKEIIENNGFIYEVNDPEVMGLDSKYWESGGAAYVNDSNSFTMPNHDVLFTAMIEE